MKLSVTELVRINDAAKALKQKDILLMNNVIIGLDNIKNMLIYTNLFDQYQQDCMHNYIPGAIINSRNLSAFIKSIVMESEFEFDEYNNTISTINGTTLDIGFDNKQLQYIASTKLSYALNLENDKSVITIIHEEEISDISNKLKTMNKADGGIGVNYKGYYMTLFPSILPLNKADKMYLSILEYADHDYVFTGKFKIKKKNFDVFVYINYLKI